MNGIEKIPEPVEYVRIIGESHIMTNHCEVVKNALHNMIGQSVGTKVKNHNDYEIENVTVVRIPALDRKSKDLYSAVMIGKFPMRKYDWSD